MQRNKNIAVALGVLCLGVLAAYPFRRLAPRKGSPNPEDSERPLTLQVLDRADTHGVVRVLRDPLRDRRAAKKQRPSADPGRTAEAPIPRESPPPAPPQPSPRELKPLAATAPAAEAPREPRGRRHLLMDGDSLESLAARYLGDERRAGEIYAVNRHVLTSPDLLPLGVEIQIPAATPPEATAPAGPRAGTRSRSPARSLEQSGAAPNPAFAPPVQSPALDNTTPRRGIRNRQDR